MVMFYCYMFAILVLASSPNSVDGYSFIDFMNALLGTPTKPQFSTFKTSSTPTTTTGCVTSDGEYACGEFFKIEDKQKKLCMFAHCSDLGLIVLWEAFPCYPYAISTSYTVSTVPSQSISGISSTTHNEPQKSKNQNVTPSVTSPTSEVLTDTTSFVAQETDTTTSVSKFTSVSSTMHNEPQAFASTSTESVTDTTSYVIPVTDTTTPELTSTESISDMTSVVIHETDTTTPESTSSESVMDTTSVVTHETDTTTPESTSSESVMDTTSVVTHETDTTTPESTSTESVTGTTSIVAHETDTVNPV